MITLETYTSPPSECGYLPEQLWSLHYEIVEEMTAEEYGQKLQAGWRR